ncbi:hypothetical protein [Yokenella regensburgei]|uniref:hypothetical protein n=1 Tax=Yokenella regensburgei TaxID=158877 RepID=UPI0013758F7E|nr:hypothetical protein [Yokenella regensburgei]KAF1366362.1 hypothetical protein FHR25_005173 [Yokenella regensburgei]
MNFGQGLACGDSSTLLSRPAADAGLFFIRHKLNWLELKEFVYFWRSGFESSVMDQNPQMPKKGVYETKVCAGRA